MSKALAPEESDFKVRCSWCGIIMPLDSSEDSRRMCPECYHNMLIEHLRSQQRISSPLHASER